jgi:hypothetical protein
VNEASSPLYGPLTTDDESKSLWHLHSVENEHDDEHKNDCGTGIRFSRAAE